MSIKFAESIIESMVDKNGHCGERGLSYKQFNCLSRYLVEGEWQHVGGWVGTKGGRKNFYSCDFEGNIGKYHVVLNLYAHFNDRHTVREISLRPVEEVEAENRLRELAKFENSEWCFEPKKRVNIDLTLVRVNGYDRPAYSGYGFETVYIYTFADENGNCFVWKTTKVLDWYNEKEDEYVEAELGDIIHMKATVKEHGQWKDIKQTVINRPKVLGIN